MKPQDEVISILRENGIEVIMKPVAMIPVGLHYQDGSGREIGVVETDIYDALQKLENRRRVLGDPFSNKKDEEGKP